MHKIEAVFILKSVHRARKRTYYFLYYIQVLCIYICVQYTIEKQMNEPIIEQIIELALLSSVFSLQINNK